MILSGKTTEIQKFVKRILAASDQLFTQPIKAISLPILSVQIFKQVDPSNKQKVNGSFFQ